ncbi:MAG: leucine-rich repeat protein [Ruminococcus sp.]
MKKKGIQYAAGMFCLSILLSNMAAPVQAMNVCTETATVMAVEEETPTEGTCGESLTWKLTEDGTLEITGTGAMEDWEQMRDRAWDSLSNSIKKIVVNEGVTSIGQNAFYRLKNLTEVSLPEGLETISAYAFSFCTSLSSVTLPSTFTEFSWQIFFGCTAMEEILVSEENTEYTSVDGILYDKDVQELFWYPSNYDASVYTIPETVTDIASSSIIDCINLKEIVMHKDVADFPSMLRCNSLERFTVAEENPYYADMDGVLYNKDFTELIQCPPKLVSGVFTIPDGVEIIGDAAFNECAALTGVEIPDSVVSVELYAFLYCDSMLEIVFPAHVAKIDYGALDSKQYGITRHITIMNPDCEIDDGMCNFILQNVVMYGYKDSTAEAYANKNSIEFHEIGSASSVTTTSTVTTTTTTTTETTTPTTTTTTETTTPTTTTTTETTTTTTSKTTTETTTTSLPLTGPEGMDTTTTICTTTAIYEDFYYNILEDYNVIILSYTGTADTVEVPSVIYGMPVTVIGANAFAGTDIQAVVIPDSVTEIGEEAFLNCENLSSMTIKNPDCVIHAADYLLPDGIIIYGVKGSTAEAFAESFSYTFQEINSITLTEEEIGDISLDGTIGIDDATMLLEYYAKNAAGIAFSFSEDEAQHARIFAAADINKDGKIGVEDATLILTYYAQNAAGFSPTWESVLNG